VSTQVQAAGNDSHLDVTDVSRRLKAIFIDGCIKPTMLSLSPRQQPE
jgi:hypothetical protein